jgi:hypothetical protein
MSFEMLRNDKPVSEQLGRNNAPANPEIRMKPFPILPPVLLFVLCAGASHAADCPGKLKNVNKKNVNAIINCLNAENAARIQENGNLLNQINALKAQVVDVSSFQAQIESLQRDIDFLKGLPPVAPIGSFENTFMKVQAVGLIKRVSATTGRASFSGTFEVQNKTASPLYIAWERTNGFAVTDNAGNTASCSGLSGSACSVAGIAELRGDVATNARSGFSVLAPNSILSFGMTTNEVAADVAARLGNRFNLTFTMLRYLDPGLVTGAFDSHAIGFAGIAATP